MGRKPKRRCLECSMILAAHKRRDAVYCDHKCRMTAANRRHAFNQLTKAVSTAINEALQPKPLAPEMRGFPGLKPEPTLTKKEISDAIDQIIRDLHP